MHNKIPNKQNVNNLVPFQITKFKKQPTKIFDKQFLDETLKSIGCYFDRKYNSNSQ